MKPFNRFFRITALILLAFPSPSVPSSNSTTPIENHVEKTTTEKMDLYTRHILQKAGQLTKDGRRIPQPKRLPYGHGYGPQVKRTFQNSAQGQTPAEEKMYWSPFKFPSWGLPFGVYSNGGFFNPGLFPFVPGGPGFPPYDGIFGGMFGPGDFPKGITAPDQNALKPKPSVQSGSGSKPNAYLQAGDRSFSAPSGGNFLNVHQGIRNTFSGTSSSNPYPQGSIYNPRQVEFQNSYYPGNLNFPAGRNSAQNPRETRTTTPLPDRTEKPKRKQKVKRHRRNCETCCETAEEGDLCSRRCDCFVNLDLNTPKTVKDSDNSSEEYEE